MQNDEQKSRIILPGPRNEHPSTYVVLDHTSQEELKRLTIQDRAATRAMGGVLPEQADPDRFRRILDVGCGTGGWLLEVAKTYTTTTLLIGVDISGKMVEYARAQAAAAGVSDRVEFHVMDALRMLEFPSGFFDLVNLRFGTSYLRKWDWLNLLREFRRVAQAGGVIRIVESDIMVESSSPTLTLLFNLQVEALYNAGHFFESGQTGVTGELARILDRAGMEHVQTHTYKTNYQSGTVEMSHLIENITSVFRVSVPFLHKWSRVPDDYEALYQQMLDEIHQPDFVAGGDLVLAWGNIPL